MVLVVGTSVLVAGAVVVVTGALVLVVGVSVVEGGGISVVDVLGGFSVLELLSSGIGVVVEGVVKLGSSLPAPYVKR